MELEHLRRITAIGGGHGLGRLLSTLSFLERRLVGIVATTDNGGATGLLRQTHHCIAWGDIRNCLSQLVEQPLAAEVLNYRFSGDTSLTGHNFGNLLLYTLDQLSARPLDGIQLLSRLLSVDTRLLPMSENPTDLIATTHEGIDCYGEIRVDKLTRMPLSLRLNGSVSATPEAVRHIRRSDLIILGPGSFLTSVLPPLLVEDISQAIADSQANVLFIDNLVAEKSPAGQLSLAQRLAWLEQQLGHQLIDAVISNNNTHGVKVPVINSVQADSDVPHRHDAESLLQAIRSAVAQFHSAA
ncbi:conserved hypothetical protein, cofD-related [Pseudidiomarina planktonica]|uniref:Putative gluconeogenesis factor n=1 Tax=Pseudidiomarina planktonica TaxID=1323738 RepID=A0A1Y6EUG1_9GAMM|nr:uridine diphosphate-N-acetylglucosamine-binding protein YvcK [Pseudidiomarina planktonica]RUO65467.1 hypothetical protein CWI77_03145 [Pseudidiomarina planktonica]SMQ64871.1 conserved hypothetical protein, cofD-related [Pseudidiomarina planktonica]